MRSNAGEVAAELRHATGTVNAFVGLQTARFTQLLRTRVRARASGRPGPRRQTGDYRRSIGAQTSQIAPGVWQGTVGTNSPQGWRLEKGFVGRDSLGREYHQPPYEHFGPAVDETDPEYAAAMAQIAAAVADGKEIHAGIGVTSDFLDGA
jgi:hypothetical protein